MQCPLERRGRLPRSVAPRTAVSSFKTEATLDTTSHAGRQSRVRPSAVDLASTPTAVSPRSAVLRPAGRAVVADDVESHQDGLRQGNSIHERGHRPGQVVARSALFRVRDTEHCQKRNGHCWRTDDVRVARESNPLAHAETFSANSAHQAIIPNGPDWRSPGSIATPLPVSDGDACSIRPASAGCIAAWCTTSASDERPVGRSRATAGRAKSQARSAVVMSVVSAGGALPLKSTPLVATLWPTPRQLEFR